MQDSPSLTLWPWALLIGIAFGALVQRSHFCTMGCISDAVLFGSYRRLRVWALAIAVAVVGSQTLNKAGLVDLGGSLYQRAGPHWLPAAVGGVLFGFGMVQAGGCISRNLVRFGSGSLKASVALLATALALL
ncbi:MAG: YeeE/YedE thiosulfate transporter family protein [Geminicoccaceae bacterium]